MNGRWGSRTIVIGVCTVAVAVIAACAPTTAPSQRLAEQPGEQASGDQKCQPASSKLLDTIASGLTVDGGSLTDGHRVKSDVDNAWYVAAVIRGEGRDGTDVGVWATDNPSGNAPIFSVNSVAEELSEWAAGGADAPGSVDDDAAAQAESCVQP